MVSLYRDPNGEHVLDMSDPLPPTIVTTSTLDKGDQNSTVTVTHLQSRILDLESELTKRKVWKLYVLWIVIHHV